MKIDHSRRVHIPVVGVRRHRMFLTDRPSCKRLRVLSVVTTPGRCLPIVDLHTERTGMWPILSIAIIAALCFSVFFAH